MRKGREDLNCGELPEGNLIDNWSSGAINSLSIRVASVSLGVSLIPIRGQGARKKYINESDDVNSSTRE